MNFQNFIFFLCEHIKWNIMTNKYGHLGYYPNKEIGGIIIFKTTQDSNRKREGRVIVIHSHF